jgi:hypothetical protein
MLNSLLNFVTTYLPERRKPLWHTLWRQHDEQKAIDLMKSTFPLHTTRLNDLTGDLGRSQVEYRLLSRDNLGEEFWREKPYDQFVTLQIPGPLVWQGSDRQGTIYDMKFYFKGGVLIDLAMGLFLNHD